MEFCNQCPNKCPKDNLKCRRGKAYFNGESNENQSRHKDHGFAQCSSKNELVRLLSICGRAASHKSEKMLEHNIDESVMFDALTPDEQENLMLILTKLQQKWESDHKRHHHHH